MDSLTVGPMGFRSVTAHLGVKQELPDFALVYSTVPAHSAAVFTQSRFAGPSVVMSRSSASFESARGFVAISGNANVATGSGGLSDAKELRDRAADIAGVDSADLIVASTGVIGIPYPMSIIRSSLDELGDASCPFDADAVATAIMTTDTHPKVSRIQCGDAQIVGVAKGVGMMEPNMATLLTFFFTDADVSSDDLQPLFRRVIDKTFNALSIDTDTSTSDTAAVFANGMAGPVELEQFESGLHHVALDLVKQVASDGEGATKLLQVHVSGAQSEDQAKRAAKVVVNSPLVKTAVHGADPNWGRVAMALGKLQEDSDIVAEKVRIAFGDLELYPRTQTEELLEEGRAILSLPEVTINIDLGIGDSDFTVYGCDLTEGYVRLNSEYTT